MSLSPIQVVMMTLSGKDAIIPVRLSQKARGHTQTGLETQDKDVVEWATAHGFNVIEVIPDFKTGSGDWMQRKNLRPWLTEPIKLASYQHIIVSSQDRLSRGKWRDEAEIRRWAEDHGIEIWIVDTDLHWPPRNDMDRLRWEMGAIDARKEWEKTHKRNERNQRELASNDYLITKPCFGLVVIEKDDHKTLGVDQEYAPTAIAMTDRAIAGTTRNDIARWLTTEGVPIPDDIRLIRKGEPSKGRKWSPKTVTDVLRNRALVGERRQRGGYTLHFDPILAKEDGSPDYAKFRQLQAALDRSSLVRGKVRETPALLTSFAHCGKCKRVLHARFTTTKVHGHEYHWAGYRCDGTNIEPSTCKVMVRMDKADAAAWEATEAYDDFPYFKIDVAEGHDWQAELDDNAERLARLDVDAPDYRQQVNRLSDEREELKNREAVPRRVVRQQHGTLGDRREAATTTEQRRELLQELGWKFYILPPDKRGGDPGVIVETGDYYADLAKVSGLPDADAALREQFGPLLDLGRHLAEAKG